MDNVKVIELIKSIPDHLAEEICDYIDRVCNQYNLECQEEDPQEEK